MQSPEYLEEGEAVDSGGCLASGAQAEVIRYSLIMPTHNAEQWLPSVLAPLRHLGPQWEVIVVDDGSLDGTPQRLQQDYPWVRFLPMEQRGGQARARNAGADLAQGEWLVFVDSDVSTALDTLARMEEFIQARPDLDGFFGCYSSWGYAEEPPLSRFRNLHHRYVHRLNRGWIGSFWCGLGAIRRATFGQHGGFDPEFTGIEDVELGKRISDRGGRFWLEPGFEGRHLKRWNLWSMVYTDLFVRAIPWTYFGYLGRTPTNGLNLAPSQALPPAVLALAILLWPWAAGWAARVGLAYLALCVPRYCYFTQAAGLRVGLLSVGYLAIYHLCCLLGVGLGTLRYLYHRVTGQLKRRGRPAP